MGLQYEHFTFRYSVLICPPQSFQLAWIGLQLPRGLPRILLGTFLNGSLSVERFS